MGCHCVAHDSLNTILLPQFSQCWGYRYQLFCPVFKPIYQGYNMVREESGQFIEIYEGYEGADDTFHFPFASFQFSASIVLCLDC